MSGYRNVTVLPCVEVAEAGNCSFERRWGERTSVEREIRPLAQRSSATLALEVHNAAFNVSLGMFSVIPEQPC